MVVASPAPLEDVRVRSIRPLVSPTSLKKQLPVSEEVAAKVLTARRTVKDILAGRDPRLMVVLGPCSIHDPRAALEYAARLCDLATQVSDRYFLIMRVYFEKPRTTTGWKGLINDPHLDESCDVAHGLTLARELLLQVAELGLPAATEFLDPIVPQYTADLVSWAAIGARTTEAQTHREMSSGLSMPVGFKNGTDGDIQVALDAMKAAAAPHSFLGIDQDGATSIIQTAGNPDTHLVLRGGRSGPNYETTAVSEAIARLRRSGLPTGIMVDCSHANSGKDPQRQPLVWESILAQRAEGCRELVAAMIESHLLGGQQSLGSDPTRLTYGQSITDACLGWEETAALFTAR
jgi:3-deoxy-7-phosphoheptulonate synthase